MLTLAPFTSSGSSRVRDLVDILLIATTSEIEGRNLSRAMLSIFNARASHEAPTELQDPPSEWERSFPRLQREVGLKWSTLGEVRNAARQLLDLVLRGEVTGTWKPSGWDWSD